MKLAVIGSRTFNNTNLIIATLDKVQDEYGRATIIISGGAKGADRAAEAYAASKNIQMKIFLPDYKAFGRSAPLKRNLSIVQEADIVVAFWDGLSRGTMHAINEAKKAGKEVILTRF